MFEQFFPKEYLDSTYEIDFERRYAEGKRGIIFDIDNTLVPHGLPADQRAIELFERLKSIGYQTVLLSNNKEPRVKSFAEQVDSLYIYKSGKPMPAGYEKALELMQIEKSQALFIGDQIYTDVWGAKRCGIDTILVKPIHPKEEIQIILKRYLEKPVLYCYKKRNRK